MFVFALAYCMLGGGDVEVLQVFAEAIRLSGYPQDFELLWKSRVHPSLAEKALGVLLSV